MSAGELFLRFIGATLGAIITVAGFFGTLALLGTHMIIPAIISGCVCACGLKLCSISLGGK